MRYIGNKQKLLNFIETTIKETYGDISQATFCDLFAGTCTVSKHFKPLVKHIITNDIEKYSNTLAKNYICNNSIVDFVSEIDKLNSLNGIVGKITANFSPYGTCERMFYTVDNAMKIDAIRQEIEKYQGEMYNYLLCSLLESSDMYANTTGVYGAYLKAFNGRAKAPFKLKGFTYELGASASCYNEDANSLIQKISGDILYLDPPYNTRQYSANYHLLNYIATYDFKIKGFLDEQTNTFFESKTGLSELQNKSAYSSRTEAEKALDDLISKSKNFKWIYMSYNDEGLIKQDKIKSIFQKYGVYTLKEQGHKRYKSNSRNIQAENVKEFIHILEIK